MKIVENKIILDNIPVNAHTSKYRFKRRTGIFSDYLILQADKTIADTDYIEWQISYDIKIDNIYNVLKDGKDLNDVIGESKPEELKEKITECYKKLPENLSKRNKKTDFINSLEPILNKFGERIIVKRRNDKDVKIIISELSDYYRTAYKNNIISKIEIKNLIDFANSTTQYLDSYKIEREQRDNQTIFGFSLKWEKYPLFANDVNDDFFIEIIKKHMQYAIGYQNMIFLCVKAINLKDIDGNSIIGKLPSGLKNLTFVLDKNVIIQTMKAFIIASEIHKNDILDILNSIVSD
jgi:hypothetical protein